MNPEAVTGLEIGNLGDGEGDVAALDVDIDLGAGKVKRVVGEGTVGVEKNDGEKKPEESEQTSAHTIHCTKMDARTHAGKARAPKRKEKRCFL